MNTNDEILDLLLKRDNKMIEEMATKLGLTEEQLDDLFIEAMKL